jgi:hypothetical protein
VHSDFKFQKSLHSLIFVLLKIQNICNSDLALLWDTSLATSGILFHIFKTYREHCAKEPKGLSGFFLQLTNIIF